MDISNVLHALKNVFAHTQAVLNCKAKLLQLGLLPSCLDSGREQLIIFLLWVRILISISAQRKCNIFRAGNSSSSRYSLAQRLSAPRWAECHKIMWEELEDRSAAAQLDAGNEPAVSPPAHLSIRVLFFYLIQCVTAGRRLHYTATWKARLERCGEGIRLRFIHEPFVSASGGGTAAFYSQRFESFCDRMCLNVQVTHIHPTASTDCWSASHRYLLISVKWLIKYHLYSENWSTNTVERSSSVTLISSN